MGYKPWRILSVFFALSAFTIGCTSGPQKTSNSIGKTDGFTQQKQQVAGQQQSTSFPIANQGNQSNQFNQTKLPQMPQNPNAFPNAGGFQNNQPGVIPSNVMQTSRDITLPQFPQNSPAQPVGGLPQNSPVVPPSSFGPAGAGSNFGADQSKLPAPGGINPGPNFGRQ